VILDAIADRLQAASIVFPAVDLFIGIMPDQPDRCVSIYEYAGASPLEVMVNEDATLERPSIQVLIRAGRNDYPTARSLAASVQNALVNIANETISGQRFLRVHALSSVNAVGTDENHRPIFSLALQAVVER
jgi:hypothetical protein